MTVCGPRRSRTPTAGKRQLPDAVHLAARPVQVVWTMSTDRSAWWAPRLEMLPSRKRPMPCMPRLPTTGRSASTCSHNDSRASAGSPESAWVVDVAPASSAKAVADSSAARTVSSLASPHPLRSTIAAGDATSPTPRCLPPSQAHTSTSQQLRQGSRSWVAALLEPSVPTTMDAYIANLSFRRWMTLALVGGSDPAIVGACTAVAPIPQRTRE